MAPPTGPPAAIFFSSRSLSQTSSVGKTYCSMNPMASSMPCFTDQVNDSPMFFPLLQVIQR